MMEIKMTENIATREITYTDSNGQKLIGYFASPLNAKDAPAVLVCHEWWGRNDYPERRARELAEAGYVAFALDMYGDKKTATDPQTANAYMMETFATPDLIVDRANKALETLVAQPEVDAARVAIIGFCYGGKVALDLARSGADVKVAATFHTNLSAQAPAQADTFKAEVLVAHGADDSMVSLDDVETFKQEMNTAKVQHHVEVYPNTKHGFTNPSADEKAEKYGVDLGYNATSEKASLDALYALLARKF